MTNTTSDWGNLVDVRNPHGFWRFAGVKATSQWVVLPIMGFLSFSVLVTAALSPTAEQLRGLSAAVIAFAAAWVFFILMSLIINLAFSRFGLGRIIAVIVLYGLTEYVRIRVVHEVTEDSIQLGENPELYTFVGAFSTGAVMFSIAATATFDSFLYKTDYSHLFQKQQALTSTVLSTERSVEQTRSQLLNSTRDLLTSSLESAFAKTKDKNKNYDQLVDDLFRISDEVIRPLSQELTNSLREETTPVAPIKPQKLPFRSVLSNTNQFSSFNPMQFTLIIALISAPGLIVVPYLSEVLLWIVAGVIIFLAQYLSKKYVAPLFPRLPKIVKAIINSLVYSLPVGLLFLIVTLKVPAAQGVGFFVFIYGSFIGMILGWLIALSDGFRYARADVLEQLSQANDELLWIETRLQSQLWLDQKRLALIVHNDVQATILSAGLSLKRAIQSGEDAVKNELPGLRELISTSLKFDQHVRKKPSIEDVVKQLNNTWDGLIATSLSMESGVREAFSTDSLACEVCSELIREFVTNSLKHGQATMVTVDISLQGHNKLALTLFNNGKKLTSGETRTGLGTHFLNAVTLSYLLSDVAGGVQLQVEAPLSLGSENRRVAAIAS